MDIERAVRDIRHAGLDEQADCVVAHISRALSIGVEVGARVAEFEALRKDHLDEESAALLELMKVIEGE